MPNGKISHSGRLKFGSSNFSILTFQKHLHQAVSAVKLQFEAVGPVLQREGQREVSWKIPAIPLTKSEFMLQAVLGDHHLQPFVR